jgi:hypothetical protein
MSPEQASGDPDQLGPRSDIYSLGATLYSLLTGKPPLEGDDVGELLRKAQRGEFQRPRQVDPGIDPALEAVCLKAMATKPEARYGTPRLLAEEMERWMADEPVAAWREPWTRTLMRWLTRHRTGVTAAAAALLAGVVGLAAVFAVQARANAQLSASLVRETKANIALNNAYTKLQRAQAATQARYDLAVEAIKLFHTGVTEDLLLKQEQFKDLRERLLKAASDFYRKLGARLGKETTPSSWFHDDELGTRELQPGQPRAQGVDVAGRDVRARDRQVTDRASAQLLGQAGQAGVGHVRKKHVDEVQARNVAKNRQAGVADLCSVQVEDS